MLGGCWAVVVVSWLVDRGVGMCVCVGEWASWWLEGGGWWWWVSCGWAGGWVDGWVDWRVCECVLFGRQLCRLCLPVSG